jgi:hypothetical protein
MTYRFPSISHALGTVAASASLALGAFNLFNGRDQDPSALQAQAPPPVPSTHYRWKRQTTQDVRTRESEKIRQAPQMTHGSALVNPDLAPSDLSETTTPVAPLREFILGNDVQLPAALLPSLSVDTSPTIASATTEICKTFYLQVHQLVGSDFSEIIPDPENAQDDTPIHISNTHEIDRIRDSANDQYRALYGDEKYTLQMLNTSVEVRLPSD